MTISYDEILITGSEQKLYDYSGDLEKNVVVDWREDDGELVDLIGKKLAEENLSAEYTDDGLKIHFNEAEHFLPFSLIGQDRYVTIRRVQELIKDKFEIRAWRESMNSDTHCLYIKTNEWWKFMDEKFQQRMKNLFAVIDENTAFE